MSILRILGFYCVTSVKTYDGRSVNYDEKSFKTFTPRVLLNRFFHLQSPILPSRRRRRRFRRRIERHLTSVVETNVVLRHSRDSVAEELQLLHGVTEPVEIKLV
jgi:hypothetical protein